MNLTSYTLLIKVHGGDNTGYECYVARHSEVIADLGPYITWPVFI